MIASSNGAISPEAKCVVDLIAGIYVGSKTGVVVV